MVSPCCKIDQNKILGVYLSTNTNTFVLEPHSFNSPFKSLKKVENWVFFSSKCVRKSLVPCCALEFVSSSGKCLELLPADCVNVQSKNMLFHIHSSDCSSIQREEAIKVSKNNISITRGAVVWRQKLCYILKYCDEVIQSSLPLCQNGNICSWPKFPIILI